MVKEDFFMVYIPVACGAVFLIAFIAKCKNERSVGGVLLKNITSIFFIFTAVFGLYSNPTQYNYGLLIIAGLVFGMLGDIYLDLKWVYPNDMKTYLNSGFVFFGIGHLFYIPALFAQTELMLGKGSGLKNLFIALAVGLVVAVGNLLLEKPMKQDFGSFRAIVTVYCFVIATMVGYSVVSAIRTANKAFIVYAVGAVLFMISDLVLSPMYFAKGKNTPTNFIINHVTYYAGQYLIALSISLMPELV